MPTYVSPFTGTVVTQTQVSYLNLTISQDTQLYWPSNTPITGNALPRILDISSTLASADIFLPPGNEGTVGADSLIRNIGLNPIVVHNNNSSQSQIIQPGQAWYFYLSDNTTIAGTWQQIQFGTGTSAADANTLKGNGLAVYNGKLQVAQNVVDVTTSPIITNTNTATTYNWNGGNGVLTLPDTSTLTPGWFINFRNNGTGTLSIQPQGIATINGETNYSTYPGDSGTIMLDSDGINPNFITVGLSAPVTSSFTAATYDVDSVIGSTLSLTNFAPVIQTYVALSGTRTTNLFVELPPITQLYIIVNDTSSAYSLSFNVTGSVSPNITIPYGTISVVLSDGNALYVISQTITGTFFANDGSATNPSFTFTSDPSTGMYLQGTAVLGFSANGTQLFAVDNSIALDPVVKSLVRFNASIISGGTF